MPATRARPIISLAAVSARFIIASNSGSAGETHQIIRLQPAPHTGFPPIPPAPLQLNDARIKSCKQAEECATKRANIAEDTLACQGGHFGPIDSYQPIANALGDKENC
jgi:hypothetical protein